jgi:hypothetical protein
MAKKSWPHIIVALITWVFIIQCVAWITLSLGFIIHSAIFEHRSVVTSGTITELVPTRVDDGYVTLCPQFRFSTDDGTRYLHTSNSCSDPSGFEVGQAIPVRYLRGDPDSARIDTFWQTWALSAGFGIAAVVTGGVGLFGLTYVRKRRWTINLLAR